MPNVLLYAASYSDTTTLMHRKHICHFHNRPQLYVLLVIVQKLRINVEVLEYI